MSYAACKKCGGLIWGDRGLTADRYCSCANTGIMPNDEIKVRVSDFELNYVSRVSYEALRAELARLRAALQGLVDAIDVATSPDLHHHQCPKYCRAGEDNLVCDCGSDQAFADARAALEGKE